MTRTVLFYRDYRGFTGGHLKVRDYYQHFLELDGFRPQIYFTAESIWPDDQPWADRTADVLPEWRPAQADVLFLAGLDWLALTPAQRATPPAPVINLIQHVRHADPNDPRYAFLEYPAVRICVSEEVAQAVRATGRVRGPVVASANGIDLDGLPAARPWAERGTEVLISGLKQPRLAEELGEQLRGAGGRVEVLTVRLARADYLARLADARIAVCLPRATEGFYLPALEAMALGCLTVCPDCVGNRGFCLEGQNCRMPALERHALAAAVAEMQALPDYARRVMRERGRATAAEHGLPAERARLARVLAGLADRWQ